MADGKTQSQWNWRSLFLSWNLQKGKDILKNHPFEVEQDGKIYKAMIEGYQVKSAILLHASSEELKKSLGKEQNLSSYVVCECKRDFGKCPHVAAFLMACEEQYDSSGERNVIEEKEKEKEEEELVNKIYDSSVMLPKDYVEEDQFFHLSEAISPYQCDSTEYQKFQELLKDGCYLELEEAALQLEEGEQLLHFSGKPYYANGMPIHDDYVLDALLGSNSFVSLSCSCQTYKEISEKAPGERRVCRHILLGFQAMAEYLSLNHPGGTTDERGMNMMSLLYAEDQKRSLGRGRKKKRSSLSITPNLEVGGKELYLSFSMEREEDKGKKIPISNLEIFVSCVEEKRWIFLDNNVSLDMSRYSLDQDGLFWFGLMRQLLSFLSNKKQGGGQALIQERSLGHRQEGIDAWIKERGGEVHQESEYFMDEILLKGGVLDLFYEVCEGRFLPYQLTPEMEQKAQRERRERLRREETDRRRLSAKEDLEKGSAIETEEVEGVIETEGVIENAEVIEDVDPAMEEPDFVRDREASEVTKSATEPSRKVETVVLEDGGLKEPFGELSASQKPLLEMGLVGESGERVAEVGRFSPEVNVCLMPSLNRKGELLGLTLEGELPTFYPGALHWYFWKEGRFSVVKREDEERLRLLKEMGQNSGRLDCFIGKKQLQSFYYRAIPVLAANPLVKLEDHCSEISKGSFPLPSRFYFYLDKERERDIFTCKIKVKYGKTAFWLPGSDEDEVIMLRDEQAEEEAISQVEKYFPEALNTSNGSEWYKECLEGEEVFQIYKEAVPALKRLGSLMVTDDFSVKKIKSLNNSKLRLQTSSGLLKLSFSNPDGIDVMELTALYNAYRMKRRYHTLADGTIVDLEEAQILEDLKLLSDQIHLSLEDMLGEKAKIPFYRTLFLEQLMEERDLPFTSDQMVTDLVQRFENIGEREYSLPDMGQAKLRPYQAVGYRWLRTIGESGFGGILADDMGLGKTLQVLTLLKAWKEEGMKGASLVICPASLVYNWKAEAEHFAPELEVKTVDGVLSQRKPLLLAMEEDTKTDLYLVSYDMIRRDVAYYQKLNFLCVVLDEAQYIKNESTATAKAVKSLKSLHRFALTGTPIENRLLELWSIFDFLMPGFLYTAKEFHQSLEIPIMKYQDQAKARSLSRLVGPFILRRLKGDVLKDLPDKIEETRSSRLSGEQERLYDAQLLHIQEVLEAGAGDPTVRLQVLTEIMKLRQICCDPSLVYEDYHGESSKRELCHELLRMAIEGGHRVLLFSQYVSMLSLLEKDLKARGIPYLILTGKTPKEERVKMVREFNEGDIPVFMISLKAGGTGLNLTGADVVIHYDPWWNVSAQNQATDRTHRIGQTRVVTVYKLILTGTIEEKIVKMQQSKKELADSILDVNSSSILTMSQEDLLELLRRDTL